MTQVVLALVLGTLFGVGTFLLLRRDVVRVVWGVTIISQSANVYLVTSGGLVGGPPILQHGVVPPVESVTDPLVQALVLTAIVIGFGTTALALGLTYRVYQEHGTIDVYELGWEGGPVIEERGAALPDGGDRTASRSTDAGGDDE